MVLDPILRRDPKVQTTSIKVSKVQFFRVFGISKECVFRCL